MGLVRKDWSRGHVVAWSRGRPHAEPPEPRKSVVVKHCAACDLIEHRLGPGVVGKCCRLRLLMEGEKRLCRLVRQFSQAPRSALHHKADPFDPSHDSRKLACQ